MNGITKWIMVIVSILGIAGAASGVIYASFFHSKDHAIHHTIADLDNVFATDVDLVHMTETRQILLTDMKEDIQDIKKDQAEIKRILIRMDRDR